MRLHHQRALPTPDTGAHLAGVIDLVDGGDLERRIIRAGRPDRPSEAHLRAPRAVRLAARLGLSIDPATAQAITRHATHLDGVSRERIGEELRRMLAHPTRVAAADMLQRLRLDGPTLDESSRPTTLPSLRAMSDNARFPAALAAWTIDRSHASDSGLDSLALDRALAQTPSRLRAALCLSNDERDRLRETLLCVREIVEGWAGRSVAGRKRLAARGAFPDALAAVSGRDGPLAASVLADVAELASTPPGLCPAPLITGDDLVARGYAPGPRFKAALDAAYDAQLEGRVATARQAMDLCARILDPDSRPAD